MTRQRLLATLTLCALAFAAGSIPVPPDAAGRALPVGQEVPASGGPLPTTSRPLAPEVVVNEPNGSLAPEEASGAAAWLPEELRKGRHLVIISAEWCGPCRQMEAGPLRYLAAAGWSVGEQGRHVRVVDWQSEIARNLVPTAYPTIVVFDNGQEVQRVVGYCDQWKLGELFYGKRA